MPCIPLPPYFSAIKFTILFLPSDIAILFVFAVCLTYSSVYVCCCCSDFCCSVTSLLSFYSNLSRFIFVSCNIVSTISLLCVTISFSSNFIIISILHFSPFYVIMHKSYNIFPFPFINFVY